MKCSRRERRIIVIIFRNSRSRVSLLFIHNLERSYCSVRYDCDVVVDSNSFACSIFQVGPPLRSV